MTKRKIIIIAVAVALLLCAVGVGIYFLVRGNDNSSDVPLVTDFNFTVNDTLPDGEGRKATVILLGGQSNASGCSRDDYLMKNVSEEKYAEYALGYDNVYINYFATATNESEAFVKCGAGQGEAGGFFGPELGMAEKLSEAYPDRTVFIIKYAWGGSNLYNHWRSPSSGDVGELYTAFVSYVHASIDYLLSKHYDVEIEGMCWMQGESDSVNISVAKEYKQNLTNLIKDIRAEFAPYASFDGIAFVDAYIADTPEYWVHYKKINEIKSEIADSSDINSVIDTVSHGLTCKNEPEGAVDIAHYDSLSQIKLGHLFAEELIRFIQ